MMIVRSWEWVDNGQILVRVISRDLLYRMTVLNDNGLFPLKGNRRIDYKCSQTKPVRL